MKRVKIAFILVVLGVLTGSELIAADGNPIVELQFKTVYVATDATVPEREAASMLLRAQAMVVGHEDPKTNAVPVETAVWPESGIVIGWQGSTLIKAMAGELNLRDWYDMPVKGEDEIVFHKRGETYVVAANSPQGTCYAVGELLYRNGARFLHNGGEDGGDGTFFEYMTGLKGPSDYRYSPEAVQRNGFSVRPKDGLAAKDDAESRELIAKNKFAVFNGATGEGPLDGGRARYDIGGETIQPPVNEFDRHPDWFPLVDGKRWRPTGGGWEWVVEGCWMSAGFADWVVDFNDKWFAKKGGYDKVVSIGLSNSDGGRRCDCTGCQKLRASYPDESSCYFDYQTKLAERIKAHHPKLFVEPIAYIMSRPYPKAGNGVLRGIDAVDYCPYSRCFVHPYSDKRCPTNKADLERMGEWKKSNLPIGDFDYLFDTFNPPMNMPVWELAADIVDHWKAFNTPRKMPRMYSECAVAGGCGAKSRIAHYVFARKLWRSDTSADAHLADWCRVGLGEAANVMLPFFRAEAVAWTNQPVHITACFNNPLGTAKTFLSDELEKQGKDAFARSATLLRSVAARGDARTRERVRKQMVTLDYERRVFEEWVALKEKAKKTSMEIALEIGEPDAGGFSRMKKYPMKTRYPSWQGEDVTGSYAQYYRTKDALRIRITSNDPLFKPQTFTERRGNDAGFNWETKLAMMELFLQGPGQVGYFHIGLAADGAAYDALAMDATGFDSDLWKVESVQREGFWQVDFTFPWRIFGLAGVKEGDVFKVVVINDAHKRNAKSGDIEGFMVGVPFPAHHDVAVGADLKVDDGMRRRPDEEDAK